jgi:CRP-like cAMP-binding protein
MREQMRPTLAGLELFAGSTRRQLRSSTNLGTFIDVSADRVVCREGTPAREFFVIATGRVELERRGKTVAVLIAGEAWGHPRPRTEPCLHATTAIARSNACLLVYDRREYVALLARCPVVAARLSRVMTLEIPVSGDATTGEAGAVVSRSEERWLAPSMGALARSPSSA